MIENNYLYATILIVFSVIYVILRSNFVGHNKQASTITGTHGPLVLAFVTLVLVISLTPSGVGFRPSGMATVMTFLLIDVIVGIYAWLELNRAMPTVLAGANHYRERAESLEDENKALRAEVVRYQKTDATPDKKSPAMTFLIRWFKDNRFSFSPGNILGATYVYGEFEDYFEAVRNLDRLTKGDVFRIGRGDDSVTQYFHLTSESLIVQISESAYLNITEDSKATKLRGA